MIVDLIVVVTGILCFNWMLSWPVTYRIVTRPLDRLLRDKATTFYLEHGIPGYSVMYRQITYCSLIVFPKQMEKKFYQLTYGDFDFRSHLTKAQLIVAYYHHISQVTLFIFGMIVGLHDLVFFRDSPWLT